MIKQLIKILFLGLVSLHSGWFSPAQATAIYLSSTWKGKTTVGIVATFFGAAIIKEVDDALTNFSDVNKKLDDISGPFGSVLKKVQKKLEELPESDRKLFIADLENAEFAKYFDEASNAEGLVEAWKVLGESADLRKNIDALETIEYYTKNVNGNIDELTDAFKAASNKEDWFSDIITQIRSKARNLPGTSKGNGVVIEGQWMRGTEGNLGLFPKQIADKLKGRNFKNFAEFRSEFWKAVADDPDLAKQFSPGNQGAMKNGFAPTPSENQWLGGRDTYEIHHKTPIHDGGEVYDMDNLVIVTPRYHKEILDPAYHFNK